MQDLHREGLADVIGPTHIFGSRRDCLAAYGALGAVHPAS